MKRFGLIGAGGFVAPRHLKAISDTGNLLVTAFDVNDSVGVLDQYFRQASFFTEFERFDRHIDKLRRSSNAGIDYISICSPNYLHDAHCRFALRSHAHAICEKPLVLSPWNLEGLREIEKEFGRHINTILQLRLHPAIQRLKVELGSLHENSKHDVDLTYVTPRGPWYQTSWKGIEEKSGGIAANIGIHFFDMLSWLFGNVTDSAVHLYQGNKACGYLEFESARVRWFLSIDPDDSPVIGTQANKAFRSLTIDGQEVDFSTGFTDLHTLSYQEILSGKGFGLDDAKKAIELVFDIRNAKVEQPKGEYHPQLMKIT